MAETHIQLYHFEACPYCEKVRRTLRLLGLEYESHLVDPTDRSEVRKISGQSLVPVLVDGDTVVNDSTAIIEYLDHHYGDDHDLIPGELSRRGEAYILNRFGEDTWGELTYRAALEVDTDGNDLDDAGRKALQEAINREASILDDFLDGKTYAAGETLTMADIALSAFISRITEYTDFTVPEAFENVWNWYQRITSEVGGPVPVE